MAAGLGFKTFNTGDVLSATDVNGYLMQGVLVFASAAARDAAITSPQEGQFAYLKDTNVTTYYTGSAWANIDTTGMTNPMTTTGDTIYSSSGSTPARLGIGSTGNVLTVSGGVPVWAAPLGGGKVLQVVSGSIATDSASSSTSYADTGLTATITPSSATSKVLVLVSQNGLYKTSGNSGSGVNLRLLRSSTVISTFAGSCGYTGTAIDNITTASVNWLDSPATTSAVTYKTQYANRVAASNVFVQGFTSESTITLLEIGA